MGDLETITKKLDDIEDDLEITLELTLQIAEIGTWIWDIQTDHLKCNDLMFPIFGTSIKKFDNTVQFFKNRIHPEDAEINDLHLKRCFESNVPYNHSFRVIADDKRIIYIRGKGHVIRGKEQKPIKMIGVNLLDH